MRRTGTLVATLAATALALTGVAGGVGLYRHGHGGHQLTGGLDVTCDTPGVGAGTVVVVTDQKGEVLGTDTLGADTGGDGQHCAYFFAAHVADAPFYRVQVGPMPPQTLSRGDLVARNWVVTLSNW